MITERSRPSSRAGSARINRPNSLSRQKIKPRPSSAPIPGSSKFTIRYGSSSESSPLGGLRIDGKSVSKIHLTSLKVFDILHDIKIGVIYNSTNKC